MYTAGAVLQEKQKTKCLKFNRFLLKDKALIQTYIDTFNPLSCEYNFSNLYAWQDAFEILWTLYEGRLLIYDGISQSAFMPIGKYLYPEELVLLSLNLNNLGLKPNFGLFTADYLKKFPEIEKYYRVKEERDYAEYIYEVDSLCDLTGEKLHKKKNLISQFHRSYPNYEVHDLRGDYKSKALRLAQDLLQNRDKRSRDLEQEFIAIQTSFEHFEALGLEGLVITVENRLVAFSVFSRINASTYDIQFEKSDMEFKGAAQVINQETAKYLKDKCQYLNREQDLGVKGLRQAKMSYDPVNLITPYSLVFSPLN